MRWGAPMHRWEIFTMIYVLISSALAVYLAAQAYSVYHSFCMVFATVIIVFCLSTVWYQLIDAARKDVERLSKR